MRAKPFVRWAGGKRRLAPKIIELLGVPKPGGRYFEPFVGGGAVFFYLRSLGWEGRAVLGDVNEDLIALYRAVRDDVEGLIAAFAGVGRDRDLYLLLRAVDPSTLSPLERAVRALYLNRCAVNGIWRVNQAGGYNVPYAELRGPLVDEVTLRAASEALRVGEGTELVSGRFHELLDLTGRGDRVYLDPPYLNSFVGYSVGGWSTYLSERLEWWASRAWMDGARVVVSLPDVPAERDTWRGWQLGEVEERRSVATNGTRKPAACLLAVGG